MFHSLTLLIAVSTCVLFKLSLSLSHEVPEKIFFDLDLSESLFQNYLQEHQKQYTNEEAKRRLQIFQENLQSINKLNQQHESAVFGLTPFSDMTPEEFMATVSSAYNTSGIETADVPETIYPEELDYRKQNLVTEVKNQGGCRASYMFANIGDVEGQQAKKHKRLISLSEQYPLDCDTNLNCDDGVPPIEVAKWWASTPGPISKQDYPYTGQKGKCNPNGKAVVKVIDVRELYIDSNEKIRHILAHHGPLAVAIEISEEFQNYKGGVLNPSDCNTVLTAMLIVGYAKEKHWIIKNSWGSEWGEKGYLRLVYNKCGIKIIYPTEVA